MVLLFLNMGEGEITLIVLVIILFFGSKSIPTLARGLGKGIREFKDATQGIQREIENSAKGLTQEAQKVTQEAQNVTQEAQKATVQGTQTATIAGTQKVILPEGPIASNQKVQDNKDLIGSDKTVTEEKKPSV